MREFETFLFLRNVQNSYVIPEFFFVSFDIIENLLMK